MYVIGNVVNDEIYFFFKIGFYCFNYLFMYVDRKNIVFEIDCDVICLFGMLFKKEIVVVICIAGLCFIWSMFKGDFNCIGLCVIKG